MTLVEFLHPLRATSLRDKCLAAMYYHQRYDGVGALTIEELRVLLHRARVPRAARANLADVLAKSAPHVEVAGKKGSRLLWALTLTGQSQVRSALGLPDADVEIEHDVSALEALAASVPDEDVRDYVKEALKCLSVGALRAAVVFVWSGAVRTIQRSVMNSPLRDVNAAVVKYDAKARKVTRIDDLSYLKESTQLLLAQELGVFDKNQRGVLEDALDLRNKCGHPGKYSPGPKKVSSFVEDVISIVFT